MSGHSKWHSIKHKKGAADAKRGKIFTKHAKLITIAAKSGGDPDMNPGLRTAILNAKADNVPNANIDKAIKKGSGADKDAAVFLEATYEGYGPEGTAVLVEVLTDNKNRSVTNVKNIINKNGGKMGESGTVGWKFDRKGLILAKAENKDAEEAELEIIDAGADDLSLENDTFEILTKSSDLMKVKDNLEKSGFEIVKAQLSYIPKDSIKIDNVDKAKKVLNFIDLLEDDEDVNNVFSDFDIPQEILEAI